METLNEQSFKSKVFDYENQKDWKFAGDLPAIVDFYADWCGPCRMLAPVMANISDEYKGKIRVYKVDTEASPKLAGLFDVRSIPSILFIPKDGKPSMAAGALPKEDIKKAINDLMKVSAPLAGAVS
jgi:thioredoxin 1